MSLQAFAKNLLQNGRFFYRYLRKSYFKEIIVDVPSYTLNPNGLEKSAERGRSLLGTSLHSVKNVVQNHARKILIDNVLQRVTHTLNADLRRKAARRLFYGDSAPFFALVGVSLASGSGLLTKDDELEGICWEVREAVSKLQWNIARSETEESHLLDSNEPTSLDQLDLGEAIATGCNAVVYSARLKNNVNKDEYPLAVKMMFNYDAESNSTSILKAMFRETVPARCYFFNPDVSDFENSFLEWRKTLPPHQNIVAMYSVFADRIPDLPGNRLLYPEALPPRIYPGGSGRNMSLFLVMKRYDCSLKQYIKDKNPTPRVSVLLLTQLLEAVAHMNTHGIAHRDLKSDNILLDLSEGDQCPTLVVTDFGCCLCDKKNGLMVPYYSSETDKGGNRALMAPEVASVKPGPFSSLNYNKSDAWAVGTMAYELFGVENPFYDKSLKLNSVDYKESDLPPLPEDVPQVIGSVISNLLIKSTSNRMSADLAATICQLYLWAPSVWLKAQTAIPNSNEIIQWLLCMTTKILYEKKFSSDSLKDDDEKINAKNRRSLPEYELIASFLRRVRLYIVRKGLRWIQDLYI